MKLVIVLATTVMAFSGSAFAAGNVKQAAPAVKTVKTSAPNSGAPNAAAPSSQEDQSGCPYAPGAGVGSGTMYGCNHP